MPQLLKPAYPRAHAPAREAAAVRSPCTTASEQPPPAAAREKPARQQRPRTANINTLLLKKKKIAFFCLPLGLSERFLFSVHSECLCSTRKKPVSRAILFLNTWLFSFNKVTGLHRNSTIFSTWPGSPGPYSKKIYVTLAIPANTVRGFSPTSCHYWVIL